MSDRIVQTSKFLSLILRHNPQKIGLNLDANGWANVEELIRCSQTIHTQLSRLLIEKVVANNDKKRFAFSEDGQKIRAVQGHSIEIELDLEPMTPPDVLYHGTATRFLDSIRKQGLLKGNRHHVHLSGDEETAETVGSRHGKPVVLTVMASEMHNAEYEFYLSENGVYLTDVVPTEFIDFPLES